MIDVLDDEVLEWGDEENFIGMAVAVAFGIANGGDTIQIDGLTPDRYEPVYPPA